MSEISKAAKRATSEYITYMHDHFDVGCGFTGAWLEKRIQQAIDDVTREKDADIERLHEENAALREKALEAFYQCKLCAGFFQELDEYYTCEECNARMRKGEEMKKKYGILRVYNDSIRTLTWDVRNKSNAVCSCSPKSTAYKIARALNMMDDDGRLIRKLIEENRDLRNILREPGE